MGYSKKADKYAVDESIEYPYDMVIIDADSPVFRASKFVQEDYIIVTSIKTSKAKEFANKTEFYGHWKKKENGWLAELNTKRADKGKEPFLVEDFKIDEHTRLLGDIEDHVAEGVRSFDSFVGGIKRTGLAPEYKVLLGGGVNFRYEYAQVLPYKGERKEKPILFEEIRQAIIDKYGRFIDIIDGKEVDDEMAIWGNASEAEFNETGVWPYILAYIDKDIDMVYCPSINYDKIKEGVKEPTKMDCMRSYCRQLLSGDKSVDNIQGLPNITPELRQQYSVRKGDTIGAATALSYLESSPDIKTMLERVVEAYIAYYGVEPFKFVTHRGETISSNWYRELQETALLVYMNEYEDPLVYEIAFEFDEYGVDVKTIEDKYRDD
jgi:hypothetical protein